MICLLLFKSPVHKDLIDIMKNSPLKKYRVIIRYSHFDDKLVKVILKMRGKILTITESVNCISAVISQNCIAKLKELPYVKAILPDKALSLNMSTSLSRGLSVKLNSSVKLNGMNITVGLISSGVYPHVDLLKPHKKVLKFLDLVNGYSHPYDDYGHGTAVAGLISSSQSSGPGSVLGLSPESHLYVIKAFNNMGIGYLSSIIHGISILIDDKEKYNVNVICLPFQFETYDKAYLDLIDTVLKSAKDRNVVVVVPASIGENETSCINGFALSPYCITIGGLSSSNAPLKWSTICSSKKIKKPDFWFPCTNLNCLNTNVNYISERDGQKLYPTRLDRLNISLTSISLASALVSSLIALAFQYNKNYTWDDIYSILKYSVLTKTGEAPNYPIINIPEFFSFTRPKEKP